VISGMAAPPLLPADRPPRSLSANQSKAAGWTLA